jgi:hypothetical protein
MPLQFSQNVVDVQQIKLLLVTGYRLFIEFSSSAASASLETGAAPGAFHENPPHCFRGCGEEMPPVVPGSLAARANQPQIRLVNQRCWLERMPRIFMCQMSGGQAPQFIVDQEQKLIASVRVARIERGEQLRDLAHAPKAVSQE